MSEAEQRAKERLMPLVGGLEEIRERLQVVIGDLPLPTEEGPPADAVALSDLLRCVLVDRIAPAIRDLRQAAGSGGEEG